MSGTTHKRPRPGFYEPVSNVDELLALRGRWLRDVVILRRWLWSWVAVSLLLIAINLASTAFDVTLSRGLRAWSAFPVLSMALLLTPLLVRDLWLRRSALAAQRRLLGHRGLLGRESEIRAVEDRISREASAFPSVEREAGTAMADAREVSGRRLEELSRIGLDRKGLKSREQRETSERELIALLDAYGQALETLEIDVALDPGLFQAGVATQSLHLAARLLEPSDGPSDGPPDGPPEESPQKPATETGGSQKVDYSVAVLPFADLSAAADQEYFANGLAEELISALTKIRGLRVIARSSAFSFRGEDREEREIGLRLGVDALIRGSVRKAGERLRVTVQLVDTSEGQLLWSERYDGEAADVFAIQDQLTASVIDHLRADLMAGVPERLTTGRTTDIDAYHFYLRGRHLWNKRTPADLLDSLHYFEQALSSDPEYALAHAGLADSYNLLGYYSILAPKEAFPKARLAAQRALAVDDTLAEAHCSLAFVLLLHDWDWREAEQEFLRTLDLSPGYATAHHWYAEYLTLAGRPGEAVARASEALKLDPVSPIINVLVGWVYYYARRYEEAIDALRVALLVDPEFAPAEFWLGLSYEQLDRPEEAESAFERAISHSNRSPMFLAAKARLLATQGDLPGASALLEELRGAGEASYVPAYYMAAVYAGYADREHALEWLERALTDRESWMVFLGVDPLWDPFREGPRFQTLVDQVGLPASGTWPMPQVNESETAP